MANIFHSGDLQSGISLAIQEQKLVACFVRQEDDEPSNTWESEWLPSPIPDQPETAISTILQQKAILLRIEHGSQEAQFLSAFCPVEKVPTLAIIRNGTVVDKLEAGVERGGWVERILKVIGANGADDSATIPPAEGTPAAPTEINNDELTQPGSEQPDTTSAPADTTPHPTESSMPAHVQQMLSERGRRLETERLRREAHAKQERIARARAEREAADRAAQASDKGKERATSPSARKQKARVDWVQQQAKRKAEAAAEKQRILSQIEADKTERRRREEERREAASGVASSPIPTESAAATRAPPSSGTCALQIRLFDGSSIKGRFAHDATLSTSVRTWVKETSPEGGADIPFNFRLLQTPAPSRTIEMSEEDKPLSEVGLMPTATLVLVPIPGYTEAYSASSSGLVGSVTGLVGSAASYLGSGLGYLTSFGSARGGEGAESRLYMGGTSDEQEPSNRRGARMAGADTGTGDGSVKPRVKTLADQREERNEFYNGNSLGFEGRKEDDDGK